MAFYIENVAIFDVFAKNFRSGSVVIDIELGIFKHVFFYDEEGSRQAFENAKQGREAFKTSENVYLLPGFIDAHVHLATDPGETGEDSYENVKKRMAIEVAGGVTTVRDMAGDTRRLAELKRYSLEDLLAPDLFYAALFAGKSFFVDPRTHLACRGEVAGECSWMKAVTNQTDLIEACLLAKGTGATAIKIYADVDATTVAKICTAAKKVGLKVWAHAATFPARPSDVVKGGVDVISHVGMLANEYCDDVPQNLLEARKHEYDYDISNTSSNNSTSISNLLSLMKERNCILDATLSVENSKKSKERLEFAKEVVRRAYAAGVTICCGSDSDTIGDNPELTNGIAALHNELLLLSSCTDAAAAIVSATINSATACGSSNDRGSISSGKRADFILMNSNPLIDLKSALESITAVFKRGKLMSSSNSSIGCGGGSSNNSSSSNKKRVRDEENEKEVKKR